MANFMQDCIVKYACSCGILSPIFKLYFCRHCPKLRCSFCLCHEVDSHFCSNCLENIPSSEARHKKNCCANCFDCPCCGNTLFPRAISVVVPSKKNEDSGKEGEGDAGKAITKKMYYLFCLSCRWSSRDVGVPDQTTATGAWPDHECSYQTRFNSLLEYFQAVVLQDKQEKQEFMRRKAAKAHKFPSLTDRTGLTVSIIRRQIGWCDKTQKPKPVNISPAAASVDVEPLPESIFTQKINLMNITTIRQRHRQPSEQPFSVNKLYPSRRLLWIKRTLRCRQCEHNVIKPEYNPTSIKYRIQLFANYHIPDVLVICCEQPLKPGKRCSVILKLSNPTMHEMSINILTLPTLEEELQMIEEFKKMCSIKDATLTSASDSLKSLTSTHTSSLTRQTTVTEEPRMVVEKTNASIEVIPSTFVLSQRDDSKEYDDDTQATKKEDPDFIIWRKGNKVNLRLYFTPDEKLQSKDTVTLGFTMHHTYVNTVSNTPDKKDPTIHDLKSRIYINVGEIA